ncbi:pyridine nucleotidedisulfide oxidoreductase domain containing protein [Mucor ambiguus]|uniref:Pyridine nucleotidedisulfide oxidoreductase domain containing protein n=1 Tax=Mucor ambiguus TaxID=91626 RepID=A0A0C9MHP9_9FUNG|nr:pyridine nucleotidedisulfide oxidoreductase domain containing protein [Mucor ambiguus]
MVISSNNATSTTTRRNSIALSTGTLPTLSSFEFREYKRLHDILSSPEQLAFFQTYLQKIHAHESLLFIEALSELRHDTSYNHIEQIVNRIWKTFLVENAPLELNVKNKQAIGDEIKSRRWGILTNKEALELFKGAETEVKIFLNEKVIEFDQIYQPTSKIICHDPEYTKYQKKVVIIGGGFTGFTVASILDPMPRFHVTLIDTKGTHSMRYFASAMSSDAMSLMLPLDSFEYTPGMIKLLVRPEETSSLRVRHDAYVKQGRVIIGYADQIVDDAKNVKVNDEYIPFDYLVIATGSTYQSKLKSFDTSSLYRLSELATEHQQLKHAKSVLIIGGGLVGCELASEIASHTFSAPYSSKKKITLIDCHDTLVSRSSVKRQHNATNYIKGLGVQVILNEKIVDFDSAESNTYLGSTGTRYAGYDKVFLATGTAPCNQILKDEGDVGFESCLDHWGRVKVKPTLQLDHWKYNHIFSGGDVTNVDEEKTGYAATLAGVCIARNICRMEKGKAPLKQGSKGTLPAPSKPLHGIESRGGIGRQHLNTFKKAFSFLNPSWAALKYFDEKEFLNLVQGEAKLTTTAAIGKKPRMLDLDRNSNNSDSCSILSVNSIISHHHLLQQQQQQQQTKMKTTSLKPCTHNRTLSTHSAVEVPLEISATNMSGSDIISTQPQDQALFPFSAPVASVSAPDLSQSQKSSCACSYTSNQLKPRPSTDVIPKEAQQQTVARRPKSNDEIRLMDTERAVYHRKINSQ